MRKRIAAWLGLSSAVLITACGGNVTDGGSSSTWADAPPSSGGSRSWTSNDPRTSQSNGARSGTGAVGVGTQDSDQDDLSDEVELREGLNPNAQDSDGDGCRDTTEYLAGGCDASDVVGELSGCDGRESTFYVPVQPSNAWLRAVQVPLYFNVPAIGEVIDSEGGDYQIVDVLGFVSGAGAIEGERFLGSAADTWVQVRPYFDREYAEYRDVGVAENAWMYTEIIRAVLIEADTGRVVRSFRFIGHDLELPCLDE